MSNPNYDNRYAKPADIDAKIATQAATDAGQYALKPSGSPAAGKYVDGATNAWTTLPTGSSMATPGSGIDLVEGVDVSSDGHSYGVVNISGSNIPRLTWFDRVQKRILAASYTNNNVSGSQAADTAGKALSATIGTKQLILWDCTINDVDHSQNFSNGVSGYTTAIKTYLAIRRAGAKWEAETVAGETGTWTTITDTYASGGSARQTTVQNSTSSYTVSGATAWTILLAGGVGSNSFGTAVVAIDGTTTATVPLTGIYTTTQNNGSRTWFPYAISVTTSNTSSHTITITKSDAGSGAVIVDAIFVSSVAPPLIVMNKAIYPTASAFTSFNTSGGASATTSTVDLFNSALVSAVNSTATDGSIIVTDPQAAGFTASSMTADGLHPNNLGAAFMATVVQNALRIATSLPGVNFNQSTTQVGSVTAGSGSQSLTNTSAPVVSGSSTVGNTLTTTNGSWSATPDSYTYQWRRGGTAISGANASTYTTVSADNGLAVDCVVTAIKSGYTNASQASNAISVGAASSGASDNFNRADSTSTLGTATSGQAWSAVRGTWGISNGAAYAVTQTDDNVALIQANLTDQHVSASMTGSQASLIARSDMAQQNCYVGYFSTGNASTIYKRVSGTYVAISTGSTIAANATIELDVIGTTITIKVNGVTNTTVTDTSITTGTYAGLRQAGSGSQTYDNFIVN